MEVEASKTEYFRVHINRRRTLTAIMDDMIRFIRPDEVRSFDDWHILDNGDLIGVTEYRHGSDSNQTVGKADQKTIDVYAAIQTIRRNMDVLPEED